LTSWIPGMLLMYFLNDFDIVPITPIITGITFVFILLLLLHFLSQSITGTLPYAMEKCDYCVHFEKSQQSFCYQLQTYFFIKQFL
jgi:hypothetical protein